LQTPIDGLFGKSQGHWSGLQYFHWQIFSFLEFGSSRNDLINYPILSASAASICLQKKRSILAFPTGNSRGNLCVPPAPGITPRLSLVAEKGFV